MPDHAQEHPVEISPAERISELNSIDKDIVALIRAAGEAAKSLTQLSPLPAAEEAPATTDPSSATTTTSTSLSSCKAAFTSSAAEYFRLLDSVSARLRRQIFALEEADIIPPDLESAGYAAPATGSLPASQFSATRAATTSAAPVGGLGNLDVGWLNSRSGVVSKQMEAELWAKSRTFLEEAAAQGWDVEQTSHLWRGWETFA